MKVSLDLDLNATIDETSPSAMTPTTRKAHGNGLALQVLLSAAAVSEKLTEARDGVVKSPNEVANIPAFELGVALSGLGLGFVQAATYQGTDAVKMRTGLLALRKGLDHILGWVNVELEAVLALAAELEAANLPLGKDDAITLLDANEILVGRKTLKQSRSGYGSPEETTLGVKLIIRADYVQVLDADRHGAGSGPLYDAVCAVLGPRLHPSIRMARRFEENPPAPVAGEEPVTVERIGTGLQLKQRVPSHNCAPEVTIRFGTAEERARARGGMADDSAKVAGLEFNGDAGSATFKEITRKLVGIAESLCEAEGVTLERDESWPRTLAE